LARGRIFELVRGVRWRWRTGQILRGLVWVGSLTGLVVFASAYGLERVRFAPEWVVAFRYLTWGTLLLSTYLFLIRPLLKRVTDSQVALYLEEHEPTLEHSVVSALDEGASASPALRNQVIEVALERARQVQFGRRVEQGKLYRFAGALTALVVLALGSTLLGPAHLRHGLAALLMPTRDAAEVSPYSIGVTPGDVTIPRNSDQMVAAMLGGFAAADASIFTRTASDGGFQRLTMLPGGDGGFEVLLLGVAERTEYFIESTGVRSPTFTIEVADLPYVGQLDLTYHYPAYTGLPPRVVEAGGDVAALPGTVVELRIEPTMLAPSGRLMLDEQPAGDLTLQEDGTFVTRFTVGENRYYSIELARDNGALVPASPEYTIDLLSDQAPTVGFSRPGRDDTASPIEEFYLEIDATDDYGVRDVRLVYSVNGGPEDTIAVYQTSGAPLAEVAPAHTLFLEEWQLEPGDLVSYYAIARDNRPSPASVTSDIYFISVRPFERAYRQAEQGGGGGGGGGQQETPLSELQRQIVAATFNLIRQQESYSPSEFGENVNSVRLAQGRLKEQVGTLLQRMQNRGLTQQDQGFADVSAVLPLAVEAMTRVEAHLDDQELRDALPDEQEALRYLQQAEQTYEAMVQQQQGGGGGGGGGQDRAAAEELADLFELELDKLQNQYETVQRGQREESDTQVDELLEQLQELARRQEQEAERQRRRAIQGGQSSAGGSQSQRDLAAETEEAARQLQRLAREMNDRQLEETARDLQQAAEAMRQSASQSGSSAASAEAASALRRLEDARRQLEDTRQDRALRDADAALQQVEELQRQQRDVISDVRELPLERGAERSQQLEQLRERKDQMHEAVQNLERDLDRSASTARADNPQAARALQEAANLIRESKVREKLQYSRATIEQWDPQTATTLELNIEADLQALRDQLEQAQSASSERVDDPMERALDDTRQLVRGMEAMGRRLNEPGQQGEPSDQQGQQGDQQGQQGQGQQGDQQGQQGDQQGQQGQQGQGQQGQQGQGQQGQQGQGQQGQQGQGQQGQQGQGQQGQGQQGQQGGQQGGNNQAGGFGGDRDGFAGGPMDYSAFGGAARGDQRRLTPEEIRQYQRELQERAGQVADLRDRMRDMGQPINDLQAVLEGLDRLGDQGVLTNPDELAMIHEDMVDRLKRIEFGLRREVEGETDRRATLTGSDDVPDGYRALVEEYYRSLARGDAPSR
jgi:hypothetical protein